MKKYLIVLLLINNLAFAFLQKGIAVVVDDVNSKKTSELINNTDLTLFLQFSDEKSADAARKSAFEKKLLGKRIFINCDKNSKICLADNLADIIFVNKNAENYPDAIRAVRPNGTIFFKDKTFIKPVPKDIDEWSHP